MDTNLVIGKAGRIVLPKPVRDKLRLQPGDALQLETSEDEIVLRPVRGSVPLRQKQGIWVFGAGEPLSSDTVNETRREVRKERDERNLGDRGE